MERSLAFYIDDGSLPQPGAARAAKPAAHDAAQGVWDTLCRAAAQAEGHMMNMLLWILQVLAALLYGSSGVMKVFMFEKISEDVPSFGALPRGAWMALGILELVCTVGLIVPAAFHWLPQLTIMAATLLAIESLVFVWVHVRYHEMTPLILSSVLGLLMAFVAYGRIVLCPIV
jgi:hypothetical protein